MGGAICSDATVLGNLCSGGEISQGYKQKEDMFSTLPLMDFDKKAEAYNVGHFYRSNAEIKYGSDSATNFHGYTISAGSVGKLTMIDDVGDAKFIFPEPLGSCWILKKDLWVLEETEAFEAGSNVRATENIYIGDTLVVKADTNGCVISPDDICERQRRIFVQWDRREDGEDAAVRTLPKSIEAVNAQTTRILLDAETLKVARLDNDPRQVWLCRDDV